MNESTRPARREPAALTDPSGPTRPRVPVEKNYGAKSVYSVTKFERERRARREAKK